MDALAQLNTALAGRYSVEREIGAGGMATVYLARDLRHDRHVALKVLLPELGAVLGVERFQAEIKVTANLQHPSLLPLFDSGEAEGLLFYVMPYVEGESLRARLDREKQLPIDEALRIATAVAGALDYAHRHQVIHRDLKPENILLHDGQPLVADFGIALAVSKAGGQRITQTGLSLGTPAYMSPEQATGDRAIDGRTDVYSLGAVTYEMLTGEPPHMGNTAQAIIARVLTDKPRSIRASRAHVAPHVEAAIERALEKLPADRWATAKEFADALRGGHAPVVASGAVTAAQVARTGDARRRWWHAGWAPTAAVAVVSVGLGAVLQRTASREPPRPAARFVLTLPESARLADIGTAPSRFALTRDGSLLAYAGQTGGLSAVFVRAMGDPTPRRVAGTDGAGGPVFSPDGRWIAFVAGGKILRVAVEGGQALAIADSGRGVTWGDGDAIVFTTPNGILYRTTADAGPVELLARPDSARGHSAYVLPWLLPGSRAALITILTQSGPVLGVVSVPGGEVEELGVPGGSARYDGNGFVLFGRGAGTLFAGPFSTRNLRFTAAPEPVMDGVFTVGTANRTDFAVAHDGTMAFASGTAYARELVRVDRAGRAVPLAVERRMYGWPRMAPDGRRVAVEIGEPGLGRWDVWVYDIVPKTLTRLTSGFTGIRPGGWTADSRKVYYLATAGATTLSSRIRVQAWDGGGTPDSISAGSDQLFEISVGPPHTWVAARRNPQADIVIAPLDSPTAFRPFVATPAAETLPRLSPDGRLLAYVSDETGINEVYVRPIPGPGSRLQVSAGGGTEPVWARDGRELFYRSPSRLMAATVIRTPELTVTRRDTLFADTYVRGQINYDVFPDGRSFVMIRDLGDVMQANVVLNWPALLRKP